MSGLGRGLGSWKHIQFQTKIGLKITASVDFKWPPLRCSINVNGEHYFINRKIATEHKSTKRKSLNQNIKSQALHSKMYLRWHKNSATDLYNVSLLFKK